MKNKTNRVVITGLGLITPIGKNVPEFVQAIKNGVNGIAPIKRVNTENLKVKLAAEIKDYNPEDYFDRKAAKRMDRYTQFAMIAADEAIKDAGLDFSAMENTDRVGIYIGSGVGGIDTLSGEIHKCMERGERAVSPLMVPMMISNMAAGDIAIKYGIHGASMAVVTACASSTHAIGEGFRTIKHGYHDVVLAGGSEAAVNMIALAGFQNMTALSMSEDPNAASLPFDKRRGGFVLGEGGAIIVLESLESAEKRGAKILGEVLGYGATTDAYHITSPDPEGKGDKLCMEKALDEAGITVSDIGYINTHGTGTPVNDKFETKAIKAVFGDLASKIPVNSTKSMTGHLLGATGAMEVAASLIQMNEGFLHPTINLLQQDEECDLNVVKTLTETDAKYAISNSLGFGGHNACLVMKKA